MLFIFCRHFSTKFAQCSKTRSINNPFMGLGKKPQQSYSICSLLCLPNILDLVLCPFMVRFWEPQVICVPVNVLMSTQHCSELIIIIFKEPNHWNCFPACRLDVLGLHVEVCSVMLRRGLTATHQIIGFWAEGWWLCALKVLKPLRNITLQNITFKLFLVIHQSILETFYFQHFSFYLGFVASAEFYILWWYFYN